MTHISLTLTCFNVTDVYDLYEYESDTDLF